MRRGVDDILYVLKRTSDEKIGPFPECMLWIGDGAKVLIVGDDGCTGSKLLPGLKD